MHARALAAVAVPLAFTGCAGGNPAGPSATARAWLAASRAQDGAALCVLLAPVTRAEVERQTHRPCDLAVLAAGLPDVGSLVSASQWGEAATARLDGDTLFLEHFSAGWMVIAAGCRPQGDKPYECRVGG